MKVLGIDPGIERCGWGVVEKNKGNTTAISFGCFYTSKTSEMPKRLKELFTKIKELFKKYSPETIALEDLFFGSNAKTAILIGQARGVIMLAAEECKIPLISYPPLEIKMAITGYGRAEKEQIQRMVKNILHLKTIPKPDDTADALAVALTHCFVSKFKGKLNML